MSKSMFDPTPATLDMLVPTTTLAPEPPVVVPPPTMHPQVEEVEELVTEIRFGFGVVTDTAPAAAVEIASVDVRPVASTSRTDLIVATEAWGWEQVRDYVIRSIESNVGAFPRHPAKENAIFRSFCERWGEQAAPIARRAVEVHGCWWRNSPLSVSRFAKGSDPYFAEVIASQL